MNIRQLALTAMVIGLTACASEPLPDNLKLVPEAEGSWVFERPYKARNSHRRLEFGKNIICVTQIGSCPMPKTQTGSSPIDIYCQCPVFYEGDSGSGSESYLQGVTESVYVAPDFPPSDRKSDN